MSKHGHEMDPSFPGRLVQKREAAGYSQRGLVGAFAKAGYSLTNTQLGRYERGIATPKATFIVHFCIVLDANPVWVLTGKGLEQWHFDSSDDRERAAIAQWLRQAAEALE